MSYRIYYYEDLEEFLDDCEHNTDVKIYTKNLIDYFKTISNDIIESKSETFQVHKHQIRLCYKIKPLDEYLDILINNDGSVAYLTADTCSDNDKDFLSLEYFTNDIMNTLATIRDEKIEKLKKFTIV